MFDPEFLDLMRDQISIRALTQSATDPHATQTYSTPVTVNSHLGAPSTRKEPTAAGDIKSASGRAYVPPDTIAKVGDRITLPDLTDREILSIDTYYDEDGPHHLVLTYG